MGYKRRLCKRLRARARGEYRGELVPCATGGHRSHASVVDDYAAPLSHPLSHNLCRAPQAAVVMLAWRMSVRTLSDRRSGYYKVMGHNELPNEIGQVVDES